MLVNTIRLRDDGFECPREELTIGAIIEDRSRVALLDLGSYLTLVRLARDVMLCGETADVFCIQGAKVGYPKATIRTLGQDT